MKDFLQQYFNERYTYLEINVKGSTYSIQRHPNGFYYVQTTRSEIKQLQSQIFTLEELLSDLRDENLGLLAVIRKLKAGTSTTPLTTTTIITTTKTTDGDTQTVILPVLC